MKSNLSLIDTTASIIKHNILCWQNLKHRYIGFPPLKASSWFGSQNGQKNQWFECFGESKAKASLVGSVLVWRLNGVCIGKTKQIFAKSYTTRKIFYLEEAGGDKKLLGTEALSTFWNWWIDFCGMTKRVIRFNDVTPRVTNVTSFGPIGLFWINSWEDILGFASGVGLANRDSSSLGNARQVMDK